MVKPNTKSTEDIESVNTEATPAESTESIKAVTEAASAAEPESKSEPLNVAKPGNFSLDKFKSKRGAAIANVETQPNRLPVHHIKEAGDFVRLHPDEENYWSTELCFVNVPVKDGKKSDNLHLIDEEIAMRYLESKKIKRFRLALASKPYDLHFLCIIPTRNLDNKFNETAIKGCMEAKTLWTEVVRREGYDEYKRTNAKNPKAFPEPKWPSQTLEELIGITFEGRSIETEDHPGLLRLIGEKQDVS